MSKTMSPIVGFGAAALLLLSACAAPGAAPKGSAAPSAAAGPQRGGSFIGAITGRAGTEERLAGSLAATAVAVLRGAALIRTHDVAETLAAIRVAERVRRATMARAMRGEGTDR